jgi:hypothetical protein
MYLNDVCNTQNLQAQSVLAHVACGGALFDPFLAIKRVLGNLPSGKLAPEQVNDARRQISAELRWYGTTADVIRLANIVQTSDAIALYLVPAFNSAGVSASSSASVALKARARNAQKIANNLFSSFPVMDKMDSKTNHDLLYAQLCDGLALLTGVNPYANSIGAGLNIYLTAALHQARIVALDAADYPPLLPCVVELRTFITEAVNVLLAFEKQHPI